MIYFVQPTEGGPVKIGFTDNLDVRLKSLRTHLGRDLAVLATAEGGKEEERAIHERFAHLRFGRTEQFRPAPELMEFIGRPLLVDPNPMAVEAVLARRTTLRVQTSNGHTDWLDGVARHYRTTVAGVIDRALAEWTEAEGYPVRPPERIS